MSDSASLVCRQCRLLLHIGFFWNEQEPRVLFSGSGPMSQDPVATAAIWKFLADHVYHPVRLLGEQSQEADRIDCDYTVIGEDYPAALSRKQYVEGWPGYPLAVRPRPMCDALRTVLREAEEGILGTDWEPGAGEIAAMTSVEEAIHWPDSPATTVDEPRRRARYASLYQAVDILESEARRAENGVLGRLLQDCLGVLAPLRAVNLDEVLACPGPLAPPQLFEGERALALLKVFLSDFSS